MTKLQLEAIFANDAAWQAAPPEARAEFKMKMRDLLYGESLVRDCWYWFASGWAAGTIRTAHNIFLNR